MLDTGSDNGAAILCANPALRQAWYAVARSIDVGAAPVPVTLLASKVVLYRATDGTVVAAPDRCPHREAPLSKGTVEGGCLVCPYHGWTFGDDGKCVRVPSAAERVPAPPRAHLSTYGSAERYGLVWVCLGATPADAPEGIPIIAHEDDPVFRRINTPVDVWQTSCTRMVDNFLDITHFPYVHIGTFGRAQDTTVPKLEMEPLEDGWFGYRYEVRANNSDLGTLASGQSGGVVERAMSSGFHLPFDVRSTIRYGTGLEHILLLLSTPIDDVTSYFTFVVWRNDDFSVSAEEVIRFDMAIGAEDKRMLEMLDGVLPLDQTTLVNVQADKCSVEWRRRLVDLVS
jgi:phenylpropionate dioxygenase-like ring-hydroxylating dioxygenase large terminal subunit